jgi:DNA-directed RNA polymerase specialized sigma24 family protein
MDWEPSSHSITSALTDGGEDWESIARKSEERYGEPVDRIGKARIKKHRRRSSDETDVRCQTFTALALKLKEKTHSFRTGHDIEKWVCTTARNIAINHVRTNRKIEGPSVLAGITRDGERQDCAVALDEHAGHRRIELLPGEWADVKELQEQIDDLSKQAEAQLQKLPADEQQIVRRWLDWYSYQDIVDECGVTHRDVRNTTFDFKTIPELQDKAREIREPLLEAIVPLGDASPKSQSRALESVLRFYFVGRGLRLLVDLRKHA